MDIYRQRKKTRWRGSRLVPRGGEVDQGPEKKLVKKDHPKEKEKQRTAARQHKKKKKETQPWPTYALKVLGPGGQGEYINQKGKDNDKREEEDIKDNALW